jgi:CSLREA domain-containing protein
MMVASGYRPTRLAGIRIALTIVIAVGLTAPAARAAETSLDRATPTVFVVTSAADPGSGACDAGCTLRAAIEAANLMPGADVISFSIGSGAQTITPLTPLPAVSDPVEIRGPSQPGYAGVPLIGLDGSLLGPAEDGLVVTAPSHVDALGVRRFGGSGIVLAGDGGSVVTACYVGTNAAGTAGRRNGMGIEVTSPGNTVGGPDAQDRNVISGNAGAKKDTLSGFGVLIQGPGSGGNVLVGNLIGTDPTGKLSVPNSEGVMLRETAGNTIGGPDPALRNVVSGNNDEGIRLVAPLLDTIVEGNYIGVDVAGTRALGNRGEGIRVKGAVNTTIGGAAAGNVISGNGGGIRVNERARHTLVLGNLIGTDATGTSRVGNGRYGITSQSSSGTQIGGTGAGDGNVISGNRLGIRVTGDVVVVGNLIGTARDGVTPIGNADGGIQIRSAGASIGGVLPGEANVIAANGGAGVLVETGSGSSIRGNAIWGNAGLGIDLAPAGVTPNDAGDADTGANGLQNHPQLAPASVDGGGTTVAGMLSSAPTTTYAIDVYASPTCDASGTGEGRTFLGTVSVSTDVAGIASFLARMPPVAPGMVITATATDPAADTSEFSGCVTATRR